MISHLHEEKELSTVLGATSRPDVRCVLRGREGREGLMPEGIDVTRAKVEPRCCVGPSRLSLPQVLSSYGTVQGSAKFTYICQLAKVHCASTAECLMADG